MKTEVLILEDDVPTREALRILLGERGFRVRTAASSEAAIEEIRRQVPDALLSDWRLGELPRGKVQTAARAIRFLRRKAPRAAVVVMSGHTESEVRADLAGTTIGAFLRKPATTDRIEAALRRCLAIRQSSPH